MKLNKYILSICCIASLCFSLVGCSGCSSCNDETTNDKGGYSEDNKTYTLTSKDETTTGKISITIPEGVTVLEDSTKEDYTNITLYSVTDKNNASEDDYVLTYTIVNENYIETNRQEVKKTYENVYKDLSVSQIKTDNYDNINYSYYTISYYSSGQSLTDYVFEINKDGSYVLAKMGTTFYPLTMEFDDIIKTVISNIK